MKKEISILLIFVVFMSGFLFARTGIESCREAGIEKLVNLHFFRMNGVVTEISDRVLTISVNEQVAKIFVREDASVKTNEPIDEEFSYSDYREISFEDIKIGNSVSIFVEQKENMELEALSVNIQYIVSQ